MFCRILDSLRFPSSPSPSIIAAPLAVLYFGLICKEVAKVVPAQTLADQELTETMQRLDDKIGLMLESDGELFNKSFWDKRYLMRQIEKYGYLFSAFSEQLVVYLSNFLLSKLVSGISADIYTSRVSNFLNYTPFMYFRSQEQVKKLGRVPLINCAKTSMSSKLISGDRDFFANLVVDAVLSVKMTNQRGEIKYPIKGINILKAHGQSARDSYLLKGYALNTGSAAQGCH
ncbi:hypothetical protein IGI04_039834 [Brassica rapa subsp. trilocularis]|uniref:Uncharacterized protein n=1 Tax=Brassica rapa subsp. trilocularis TaxID=1813537 RepID=A0ABQ7KQD7_BRACM|nr:hypothetical protein IGI04_039834 [Brassica rapa subsp. trilocularis]